MSIHSNRRVSWGFSPGAATHERGVPGITGGRTPKTPFSGNATGTVTCTLPKLKVSFSPPHVGGHRIGHGHHHGQLQGLH